MRAILDIPLSLKEIVDSIDGFAPNINLEKSICAISTDTRNICKGDLFIPLKGENFDGEDFCDNAKIAGCDFLSSKNASGILVKNTKKALLGIASLYKSKLKHLKLTIAITGSVGKTTTKEFLKIILREWGKTHTSEKNYNNYIGLAFTIFSAPKDIEYLIAELGANHIGEIEEMSLAINPNIAVITQIGTAHIGNFGSRQMISKAKTEIIAGLKKSGVVLIPHEEELLSKISNSKTVSISDKNADYILIPIETRDFETSFDIFNKKIPSFSANTSIFGRGNLKALSFAVAAAIESGMSEKKIKIGISNISRHNTRQNCFIWSERTIIDDSYNASLESIVASFEFMKFFFGRRCAVIGDILELGSETESIHFKIGLEAVKHGTQLLFLVGVYSPFIARGAVYAGMPKGNIFINTDITDTETTLNQIKTHTKKGDVILFKASHKSNFSELCNNLKQKGNI